VIDLFTRELVRRRAKQCCEYCGLHEDDDPLFAFHVEHIIPRQHGGGHSPTNLAYACHQDNLRKGPNLTGIDPITRRVSSYSIRAGTNGLTISAGKARS
jgi:5-methylcytosine-specific restriction endonuclease McrA